MAAPELYSTRWYHLITLANKKPAKAKQLRAMYQEEGIPIAARHALAKWIENMDWCVYAIILRYSVVYYF